MEDRRKEKQEIGCVQTQPDTSSTPSTECHWRSSPRYWHSPTRHERMRVPFSSIYKYLRLKAPKNLLAREASRLSVFAQLLPQAFSRLDWFFSLERHNGVFSIVHFLGWQTTRINIAVIVSSVLLSNIVDMLLIRVKKNTLHPFRDAGHIDWILICDIKTCRVLW